MAGYRKDVIFVEFLLFHIAIYPIILIPNTKNNTRRARNTQARDLASPQKRQKKKRKAAPDEQETPKRRIWHRPQKDKAIFG